jgi:hypothetical protein
MWRTLHEILGGGGGIRLSVYDHLPVWKVCIWQQGNLGHAILMFSIYLLLNFQNICHAISKLSSQDHLFVA